MRVNYHGEPLDLMPTLNLTQIRPLLECTLSLTRPIDVDRLQAAVRATQAVVPQIQGRYNVTWNRFEVDEALEQQPVIEEYPASHDPERVRLDVLAGPQLKIQVIHHAGYDRVRLAMSRLLTDGEGFKHYLYLLSAAYAGDDLTRFVNERSGRRIVSYLRHPHRPLPTLNDLMQSGEPFPTLSGDVHHHHGETVISRLETRRLQQKARQSGVTLNAVLLAAYALALATLTGDRHLVIPAQVDLRLHGPVAATNVVQVANLTSEMPIPITVNDLATLEDVVQQVQATLSDLHERLAYLTPLVEINRMSRALPPQIVRRLAGKYRPTAAISFANFGRIDQARLQFAGSRVSQVYFAGAYQTMPYFQLTASGYRDAWTLAFRMLGSEPDYQLGIKILKNVATQLTQWVH
ncbi:condensation domain-containing protein [Levilactobacillus zymae]|uniref:condensation domain-containing protein n=1 Tax=Levilactobacillus zymae TaxID=267363 RepID=UPI003FCECBE9